MKKRFIISILLNTFIASVKLLGQNTGIGEPNPASKLSVKGNSSVGTNYSTIVAPTEGMIIEGQTGIGTSAPGASSILDISSTDKGVLIPRLTTSNRISIPNAAVGLIVFDTDLNAFCFMTTSGWVVITGQIASVGATGATGPTGPQGMQGFAGSSGVNGLDGMNGTNGANGINGSTWLSGAVAPTTAQGAINDYYLNSVNGNYYKKTNAMTWTLQGSLKGATGANGATGAAGANGTNGATGATGPTGAGGAGGLSGTTNYVAKFTSSSTIGDSRIFDNGTYVGIGTVAPSYPLHVASAAPMTGYFTNNNSANDPIWGYNTAAASNGGACGIVGITSQTGSLAAGIWGENYHTSGTGVVGFGNGAGAVLMAGGSGGAFTGTVTGLYAKCSSAGASQAIYTDNFGSVVRVNYWSGSTQYKIQGAGTVSTVVKDLSNQPVVMHATETPEIYLQDYGQDQLVNGKANIAIDPVFAKNVTIDEAHPLRVYVQLEGDCNGVFVTAKCPTGFDVVELNGGSSNTPFQWTIVCNRADEVLDNGLISKNADMRFEPAGAVEKLKYSKGQLKEKEGR